MKRLLKKKALDEGEKRSDLNQNLTALDLTLLGVAAIIGAGIFSTIGSASYHGGPGVSILFVLIAISCGFSALCYAEFAARIPQSGSAYTYAYVSFGQIFGWIIGWALILEYAIGNIVVAISWSGYFSHLLKGLGIDVPYWMRTGYYSALENYELAQQMIHSGKTLSIEYQDYIIGYQQAPECMGKKILLNIPAFAIVTLITWVAYIGIRESKRISNAMVGLKLGVILVVIGVGFFYVSPSNWTPFLPNGMGGVLQGVSAAFFAYIGFDAISTTAEECHNPRRDLPIGMIAALLICTVLYILISLVLTGMVHYSHLKVEDPLAYVFEQVGLHWISYIISVSAVVATASVLLVFQLGQPRIWMSMSRDRLLPSIFSTIHPKYRTPSFSTLLTGLMVGLPALILPSSIMTDLTSIGTLFAFILVCLGVLALPQRPKTEKSFSIPNVDSRIFLPIALVGFFYIFGSKLSNILSDLAHISFLNVLFLIFTITYCLVSLWAIIKRANSIPILGAMCCMYLMTEIPAIGWIGFLSWMGIGLMIYCLYGYRQANRQLEK